MPYDRSGLTRVDLSCCVVGAQLNRLLTIQVSAPSKHGKHISTR